jgi:predicted kinase
MTNRIALPKLAPLLIVGDAARAIAFYVEALGATEIAFARMCKAGSVVVFPLQEFCGERMGRVRDPFGHLWLLSQRIERLPVEEIQRRRDVWAPRGGSTKMEASLLAGRATWQAPARDERRVDLAMTAEPTPNRCGPARIHLVVGPVGAGKSTFALALSRQHGALWFNLDEWMADLFRPDRPATALVEWYVERAERCVDQIWKLTTRAIDAGMHVVLEIGLIRRADRERLYRRVDAAGHDLVVYVLDAPREVRRERVESRNREKGETFSMVVPPHLFEMASDMWEPPDEDERRARDVRVGPTGV